MRIFPLLLAVFVSGVVFAARPRFPLSEARVGFGKTLADFGVEDGKTVNAVDYGFNPSNSTEFIQKALDSGATTVVIDKMSSPWRVDSIIPKSNQRILIKKGAMILPNHHSLMKGGHDLFRIEKVKNVIIEGEGAGPNGSCVGGDVNCNACKNSPGTADKSVIAIHASTNVVIRNLRVAGSKGNGILFEGNREPSVDTYLEDLDIANHGRHGCVVQCADGIYAKRVAFRDAGCGIGSSVGFKIEPENQCALNTYIHLFDCEFRSNGGGGLVFALCSDYPVRFYAKGCRFHLHEASAISVPAQGDMYIAKRVRADVRLFLEDTEIETYSNVPAITWLHGSFFNCNFTRMKIRDCGRMARSRAKRTASPLYFVLNRDFGPKGVPGHMTGYNIFKNVTIDGFDGADLLTYCDELGKVSVRNAFRGTVEFNGIKTDMRKFDHNARDLFEPRLRRLSSGELLPLGEAKAVADNRNCILCRDVPADWKPPAYTYYFYAKKDAAVSFEVVYSVDTNRSDMAANLAGKILQIDTPSEGLRDVGPLKPGVNSFSLTVPEDGWYSLRPPCQAKSGYDVQIENFKGAALALQSDTLGDGLARLKLRNPRKGYRGYFEVPPDLECHLRVTKGGLALYDASGKLVDKIKDGSYVGRYTFKFRAKGDKSEIWSFSTLPGDGECALKFYAPLNGIWADSPDLLPRQRRSTLEFDWEKARDVADGIKLIERTYEKPRLMKTFMMRVDLTTPGLQFTGTERSAKFGEPMPECTNRVVRISTRRERPDRFMLRRRAEGRNVVAAFNTAPWEPWEPPYIHKYALFYNLQISDGKRVSTATKPGGATFVVWKDGRAAITNNIAEADLPSVSLAHTGFSVILRDGRFSVPGGQLSLAPRTALGISKDGRYLYVLTVDGRLKDWSRGADMRDLALILASAGADDAMNFDGGGSTSLVTWDDINEKPFNHNRHSMNKGYYRPVALCAGIIVPEK